MSGKSLLAYAVVAVAAGLAGFFASRLPSGANTRTAAAPAAHGTESPSAVTSLGRLEPASEVVEVGIPAGSRLDRVVVKEGQVVARHAPLAYLDSFEEAATARDHARIQLEEAHQRWQAETMFGQASIETAKLHIKEAEEVAMHAIVAQEAELQRAESELAQAQTDHRRSVQFLRDAAIPETRHEQTVLRLRQTEAQRARHQSLLRQLREDQGSKMALARVELAAAAAALVRNQLATQKESLAANLKLAEARLSRSIIRAPIAGEIFKVVLHAGETAGKNPLLKMGDTESMDAVAEVYETDVRHLRPGQVATITSKAFPDIALQGRVQHITPMIRKNDVLKLDPTADADSRIQEVRIRLDRNEIARRFNYLQVDVSIAVGGSEAVAINERAGISRAAP